MNLLTDFLLSLKLTCQYEQRIKDDLTRKRTKKEKFAELLNQKKFYKLLRTIYVFIKGDNIFLNKRRRRIRNLILNSCDFASITLRRIRNYMIDEKDLSDIHYSLCFGIYNDLDFENEISKTYSIPIVAADPTPISVDYVSKYDKADNFTYVEAALSTSNGKGKFYAVNSLSGTEFEGSLQNLDNSEDYIEINLFSLEKFITIAGQKDLKNCLIKMDIEGEAVVILNDLIYKKVKNGIELPIQIAAEIELPKKIDALFYKKISETKELFLSLRKYYYFYYIPRVRMFTNIDILLVRK